MLQIKKNRQSEENDDDESGLEIFHGCFRLRTGRTKFARKMGFDTAGRLRHSIPELTARFPPFDLRKISANHGGTIPF
jgi:hypothetical protein